MTPPPNNQVAALWEEIRRAGSSSVRMRLLVWAGSVVGVLVFVGAVAFYQDYTGQNGPHGVQYEGPLRAPTMALGAMFEALLPAAAVAALLGVLLVGLYQRCWRARLRTDLSRLTVERRTALLQELQADDCRDTRRIVGPLLAELRAGSSELTPAAPPEGRGDEASPMG